MLELLFLFCLIILVTYPVLYPPIASFTAIFFLTLKPDGKLISLFLIFSCAIISALIAATIEPVSDTWEYIKSYQYSLDTLQTTSIELQGRFEPLYEIYEYCVGVIVGYNSKLFLLFTSIIFHLLSTLGILRICIRLNQLCLAYIVFSVYYALVAPAMGVPLFLLRSSLSVSVLLIGISFYKQRPIFCCILSILSIQIHSSSLFIFVSMVAGDVWQYVSQRLEKVSYLFALLNRKYLQRVFLFIPIVLFFIVLMNSQLVISNLSNFILALYHSGGIGSDQAKFFVLQNEVESFVDLYNPVTLVQILLSLLCFFKIQVNVSPLIKGDTQSLNLLAFLQSFRCIGKFQIIVIILTLPFGILPYRLGLFNFLYFPLWLLNLPFLAISRTFLNINFKFLVVFALICLLSFTLYRIPKNQSADISGVNTGQVVVLENRPLNYNLFQLIEYFI